jgi:hypothetical protein
MEKATWIYVQSEWEEVRRDGRLLGLKLSSRCKTNLKDAVFCVLADSREEAMQMETLNSVQRVVDD